MFSKFWFGFEFDIRPELIIPDYMRNSKKKLKFQFWEIGGLRCCLQAFLVPRFILCRQYKFPVNGILPLFSSVLFHVNPWVVILSVQLEAGGLLFICNRNHLVKGQPVSVQVSVRAQIDLIHELQSLFCVVFDYSQLLAWIGILYWSCRAVNMG